MKIGIDFGGVVDHDVNGWIDSIKESIKNGHEIYLISHAHPGKDHQWRIDYSNESGCINHTFSDTMDENVIIKRKFDLCKQLNIDLFIEDMPERAIYVRKHNPNCGILCFDNMKQSITKEIFDKITSK